jgi:hypothetical protein
MKFLNDDHRKHIHLICDFMGENLEDMFCREVKEHIEACPNCKVYFDTVQKAVILCRENECPETLPEEVNNRLLKVLNLDAIALKLKTDSENPDPATD